MPQVAEGSDVRIFDIGNKAKVGFWCAAPDAETAIEIALDAKHGKARENLHATDVTDSFLSQDPEHHDAASIQAIVNGTKTGRVIGQMPAAYNAAEFFKAFAETGKPPEREQKKTIWKVT